MPANNNIPYPPNAVVPGRRWIDKVTRASNEDVAFDGIAFESSSGPGGTVVTARRPKSVLGYPWGSQWLYGFGFTTAPDEDEEAEEGDTVPAFRLYKAAVRVGNTIIPAVVRDDTTGAEARYATLPLSSAILEGEWGVAIDLDWASTDALYEAELVHCTSEAELLTQPAPTETTAGARIPIAWFDGRTLVTDWVHGMMYPPIWVAP